MQNRRVVVTGLGTVNPLGNNVDSSWNNIINGKSGISRISTFPVEELPESISKVAGQVLIEEGNPNAFDVNSCVEKKDQKKMDKFIWFAMGAAKEALNDANWFPEDEESLIRTGVLVGAGISSSAAYENTIGTVLSNLYNDNSVSAVDIAIISQYAENAYFGKPCGLMDQMASSVGSLVYIDFYDPKNPIIEKVEFDMGKKGYSLCITDTKGSHSDLTLDYALVPQEMKDVAKMLGHEVLADVTYEDIVANIDQIRNLHGDRAVLRALHFINENKRVPLEVNALKNDDLNTFFKYITESGNSSYKYLQNVYTNHDIKHQNVSIALCVSEMVLGTNGVSRVHGGGFAGTIQAFVKDEAVVSYKEALDKVFGKGSCCVYKIRKYGGIKLI
jgi:galactokinase